MKKSTFLNQENDSYPEICSAGICVFYEGAFLKAAYKAGRLVN